MLFFAMLLKHCVMLMLNIASAAILHLTLRLQENANSVMESNFN